MSIDFREYFLKNKILQDNHKIVNQSLFDYTQSQSEESISLLRVTNNLNQFKELLTEHCDDNNHQIFSQFLQELIYYICHNIIKNKIAAKKLIDLILEKISSYEPIIWIDPKESYTMLHALVVSGYKDQLITAINIISNFCNGKKNDSFKKYFSNKNKDGFSLLNSAATIQDMEIMKLLVNEAKEAYSEDRNEFISFLTNINKDRFTPLNNASRRNNLEMVKFILLETREAFGTDREGYIRFINNKNKSGYTALIDACELGNLEIIKILTNEAEIAFGNNNLGFIDFVLPINNHDYPVLQKVIQYGYLEIFKFLLKKIFSKLKHDPEAFITAISLETNGWTLLNSAANSGCVEIVEILLELVTWKYKVAVKRGIMSQEESDKKYKETFVDRKNRRGYTPLNNACLSAKNDNKNIPSDKYYEIASLLLKNGANPDIKNDDGFSAKDNAPTSWNLFPSSQHKRKKIFGMFDCHAEIEKKQKININASSNISPQKSYRRMVDII